MPVPADVQLRLFMKILSFDRNLKVRAGNEIALGIVYQSQFRGSIDAKENFIKVMNESPSIGPGGLGVRYLLIDLSNESDLASAVENNHIDILYVTPVRALGMETITMVSHAHKVRTFTGVPQYVESGLAVGVTTKGERPLILINLSAAKAEGSDFTAQLLNLARIIQ